MKGKLFRKNDNPNLHLYNHQHRQILEIS